MKDHVMPAVPCEFCAPAASEAETLKLHGIVRVPAAVYQVGGFRYACLADAVAQARRQAYLAN